ncbi:tetratricopeptide repeat protein [Mariprofundus ferrooxydans]|uniref:tetratricopeptide repeat protein n=1 Tax=Mariprofundus ferrooxydans TaxID=314344 RepID=UPI00036682C0|nr:heme biosynthesis HemY N-terminal domain-containing protein [Mariprofundus ferrooxydans]
MRLIFLLVLALAVSVALIIFPDIADQPLRLEAFGWVFETRQGAFIVALFVVLLLLWLLRTVLGGLLSGPGQLWQSLSMGSRKRREKRLREALERWLNGDGDLNARLLKRSRKVLPDWALDLLAVMGTPAKDQPAPDAQADPMLTAMIARTVTSPLVSPRPDLVVRKEHLKAWLEIAPNSSLARSRMADVAEEEGNWQELVDLLEERWKKGEQSAAGIKTRLIHAYLKLAEADAEQAPALLRKAYRLSPADGAVMLAYGRVQLHDGDSSNTRRVWLNHLHYYDDMTIATELLAILQRHDPLKAYRKLDRKVAAEISFSLRWLRAELAQASALGGLAYEQMQKLAEEADYAPAWESMARWHETAGEYEQAAHCFSQALASVHKQKSGD